MVPIKQHLAHKGSKPRPGYALSPKYVTIHNTANESKGAGAVAHANLLRGGWRNTAVSWHYAVDDTVITQSIPDNEIAWHAGDGASGTGNRQSLAIEICENVDSDLRKATDNAAELAAMLLKKYHIPISHLKQHNDWSGKNCPRRIRAGQPYSWAVFVSKVKEMSSNTQGGSGVMAMSTSGIGMDIGGMTSGDVKTLKKLADSLKLTNRKVVQNKTNHIWIRSASEGDQKKIISEAKRLKLNYKPLPAPFISSGRADFVVGTMSGGDLKTFESLAKKLKVNYKKVKDTLEFKNVTTANQAKILADAVYFGINFRPL